MALTVFNLGSGGGWRIKDQNSGELGTSRPYVLNSARRFGSAVPTQWPASSPSKTLIAKNQKPRLGSSSEAKACLPGERSQVPSLLHTEKPTAVKKRPDPSECVKHVYSPVSFSNKGGGREREALSPCAGGANLGLPCTSTLLMEQLRLIQL